MPQLAADVLWREKMIEPALMVGTIIMVLLMGSVSLLAVIFAARKPSSVNKGLTARETEVLDLVCSGMSNPEIADKLCISEHTVKRHLNNTFQKAGVSNRYELISKVLKG